TIDIAQRPLGRLSLGSLNVDQVAPVLVFNAGLLSRVTDRDVLGLIGYRVMWIDYRAGRLALIPAGPDMQVEDAPAVAASRRTVSRALSPAAVPIRFRLTE